MVATGSALKKPATTPEPSRMTLAAVTRGRIDRPMRVLLYGTEGIGKTSWAAHAPSPIFLGTEDGTAQLDVARFPEPRTWKDILDAVQSLDGDHTYKTLVFDTLDWAEPLCWEAVCADAKKTSIEDLGYGRGYVAAVDKWRALLARLDDLRTRRGMHIVMLAHALINTFKNPEGDDFDRYELKLHKKSASVIKEWCDAVLFANYETFTEARGSRVRGISSGSRIVHTERRAAFDAKNRYDLPPELPLDWNEYADALRAHTPADPGKLRGQVELLIPKLSDVDAKKATDALTRAGNDATKLAKTLDWANGKIHLTEEAK